MPPFGSARVCGDLDEAAAREWLRRRRRRRLRDGHRRRAAHAPLPRAAGRPRRRPRGAHARARRARPRRSSSATRRHRLATHAWAGGAVDPAGYEQLVAFELDRRRCPRWRWQVGDVVLERELAMTHGRTAIAVVHRLLAAARPVRLELTPLCTWRDAHGERSRRVAPAVEQPRRRLRLRGRATASRGPGWTPGGEWYPGVRAARGGRARPGRPRGRVGCRHLRGRPRARRGSATSVTAAAAPFDSAPPPAPAIVAAARGARDPPARRAGPTTTCTRSSCSPPTSSSIDDAGRPRPPWPATRGSASGRATSMTSYEGLFLATGRTDEGRDGAAHAAATVSEGMLANTADTGTLEYNTVDGSLWFVHALDRHVAVDRRRRPRRRARAGRDADPRAPPSSAPATASAPTPTTGCSARAPRALALTWMDARIDGAPGDGPRRQARRGQRALDRRPRGRARACARRARGARPLDVAGDARPRLVRRAASVATGRRRAPRRRRRPGRRRRRPPARTSCSPVSLPPRAAGAASRARRRRVPALLLTPLGLRSLAPDDPAYRPAPSRRTRPSATPPTTRAPSGRGSSGPTSTRRAVGVPVDGVLDGLELHLASGASAPSRRRPTATRPTAPRAARSRPGPWPRSCACGVRPDQRVSSEPRHERESICAQLSCTAPATSVSRTSPTPTSSSRPTHSSSSPTPRSAAATSGRTRRWSRTRSAAAWGTSSSASSRPSATRSARCKAGDLVVAPFAVVGRHLRLLPGRAAHLLPARRQVRLGRCRRRTGRSGARPPGGRDARRPAGRQGRRADAVAADALRRDGDRPPRRAVAAAVGPGKTVAVVGDGAVGLCGVIAAKRLGAEQIILLGRHADRIALAQRVRRNRRRQRARRRGRRARARAHQRLRRALRPRVRRHRAGDRSRRSVSRVPAAPSAASVFPTTTRSPTRDRRSSSTSP